MGLLVDDTAVDKGSAAYSLFAPTSTPAAGKRTRDGGKAEKPSQGKEPKTKKSSKKEEASDKRGLSGKQEASGKQDTPVKVKEVKDDDEMKPVGGKAKRSPSFTEDDPARLARTVFIGNLPLSAKRNALSSHFARYGPVHGPDRLTRRHARSLGAIAAPSQLLPDGPSKRYDGAAMALCDSLCAPMHATAGGVCAYSLRCRRQSEDDSESCGECRYRAATVCRPPALILVLCKRPACTLRRSAHDEGHGTRGALCA